MIRRTFLASLAAFAVANFWRCPFPGVLAAQSPDESSDYWSNRVGEYREMTYATLQKLIDEVADLPAPHYTRFVTAEEYRVYLAAKGRDVRREVVTLARTRGEQ